MEKRGVHEGHARGGLDADPGDARTGKLDREALCRELQREALELKRALSSQRPSSSHPPGEGNENGETNGHHEPSGAFDFTQQGRTRRRDEAMQRSVLLDRIRLLLRIKLRQANRYFLALDARECERLTLDPATTGCWTSADREEVRGALEIALNLLGHEDRQAIRWFYLEQRTTAEIAQRQGIREATVWLQLKQARERFRERFVVWNEILGS